MKMYSLEEIKLVDPEIAQSIVDEQERQNSHIELIASENWVSKAVMAAMGSVLTNKYAEGYPAKRYYGGCDCVDVVENLAIERAKEVFGCDYANVQPHSGAQANMAVQFAVLNPGDTIMGMNLDHGGHLTHGSPVNMSGKYFNVVPYGVNDDGFIDYDKLRSEINKINLNDSEEIKNELLLENYEYDYFGHLPVSYSEVAFSYGINNTKVKVKYADIPFNSISKEKLAEYVANNSVKFRQYKVGKIVFADTATAKRDAEKALMELTTDPTQFDTIAENLKKENKIINFINDSTFHFAEDYNEQIASILPTTELGKVCNKLAAEPNVGYTIVKVLDTKNADVADNAVASRAKNAYVTENRSLAELDSQTKAKDIFDKVKNGEDFATVSSSVGIQVSSSEQEMLITDNILPMLDFSNDKDMEFITKLFFSKVGVPVEPYKYANGVVVAYVESRTDANMENMEADFEKLVKSSDSIKVAALRQDFYREEKKKHKVVDNFHYAIRIQDFFNMNQGQ